jgi:Rrf2 family transcriptional regulator, iron-sulfur cluster assembly transcription factor
MLSRSTGYALLALAYLAGQPPGKLAGAREIAASTGIPAPFLWKILRHLRRYKLVRSFKGVHGGYELTRSPKQITVIEVVAATQQENPGTGCVLGLLDCDEERPCLLHTAWADIRRSIQATLANTTVADMVLGMQVPRPAKKRLRVGARGADRGRNELV